MEKNLNKSSKTILIIDDDPRIRKVLKKILHLHHYNVHEAENGAIGLEIIETTHVDLVISDVDMPIVSGIELLSELNQKSNRLPVIIITGKASVDAAVECMKIGAIDYISKPFNIAKIEETVSEALRAVELKTHNAEKTLLAHRSNGTIGRFEILKILGEGSMGIVYKVKRLNDQNDNHYALKLFKRNIAFDESHDELKQRFQREAEAASQLHHPNIVAIIDHQFDSSSHDNYILMEYVDGISLKHFASANKLLTYRDKVQILYQIADALALIHSFAICHRDIKPANILIDKNHFIKITDFGVARIQGSSLTKISALVGSPGYMSPESFRSPLVDHRSDIFSFGIVAYEFLLFQHPFPSHNLFHLSQLIQFQEPDEPDTIDPEFPKKLIQILKKMLKKCPDDRYQSAHEICTDLKSFLGNNT